MKPRGYFIMSGGEGRDIEHDTFTCVHCNRVVMVVDKTTGGWCLKCCANICDTCTEDGRCIPFEKQCQAMEKGILQRLERDRQFDQLFGTR